MDLETPSTKAPSNINDYVMTFFDMDIPKMPHQHQNKDENEHEIQTTSEASISPVIIVKIPDLDMEKVNKEDTIVDGFVTSTKVDIEDQKEEKNDNDYVDYYQGMTFSSSKSPSVLPSVSYLIFTIAILDRRLKI